MDETETRRRKINGCCYKERMNFKKKKKKVAFLWSSGSKPLLLKANTTKTHENVRKKNKNQRRKSISAEGNKKNKAKFLCWLRNRPKKEGGKRGKRVVQKTSTRRKKKREIFFCRSTFQKK
jgi:hypothetical protein